MVNVKKLFLKENQAGDLKLNKRLLYWTIAIAVVVLTFVGGYFYTSGESKSEEKTVPVEVEPVRTGSIEQTIELTGWIKANSVVDITSKVGGRIESLEITTDTGDSIAVEEGLVVEKGQKLCVIDHDVYLAQVAAAQAEVKAREVELADAEREKNRVISLHQAGSGTQQSKDKAVTVAELAAAGLKLAKANLELAQINLRESTIYSQMDAIVTAKHIDQGNLIRAGDRILTIADINTVKIIVAAAERYALKIKVGMPVRINIESLAVEDFQAKVYSIHPALDAQTHTLQIEIRLSNAQFLLKPGMFARVSLIMERKEDVVIVERDVILGGKINEPYVFVVEDGIARKRIIKAGITQADRYEITQGLQPGESLVVNGMHYLEDGISVETVRMEDIK